MIPAWDTCVCKRSVSHSSVSLCACYEKWCSTYLEFINLVELWHFITSLYFHENSVIEVWFVCLVPTNSVSVRCLQVCGRQLKEREASCRMICNLFLCLSYRVICFKIKTTTNYNLYTTWKHSVECQHYAVQNMPVSHVGYPPKDNHTYCHTPIWPIGVKSKSIWKINLFLCKATPIARLLFGQSMCKK